MDHKEEKASFSLFSLWGTLSPLLDINKEVGLWLMAMLEREIGVRRNPTLDRDRNWEPGDCRKPLDSSTNPKAALSLDYQLCEPTSAHIVSVS